MSKPRLIAFYLPQFYPTKENDEWWQKGFTEWTNVGNAKPLFRGHYQPRVPADLGYYDLRVPEVREEQAQLAREAGIEGFCYWHYWFAGRRLLDRVFREVVESGKPDFPFCLCWANHSWYAKTWNRLAHENGLEGFEFFGFSFEADKYAAIVDKGFDSVSIDYTKEMLNDTSLAVNAVKRLYRSVSGRPNKVYDYQSYVNHVLHNFDPNKKVYPCIVPNFDHSPRSGNRGFILHNSTPQKWGSFCSRVFDMCANRPHEENLVFIKAWNEWGEGNYLEPDMRYGKGFIDSTKKAVDSINDSV